MNMSSSPPHNRLLNPPKIRVPLSSELVPPCKKLLPSSHKLLPLAHNLLVRLERLCPLGMDCQERLLLLRDGSLPQGKGSLTYRVTLLSNGVDVAEIQICLQGRQTVTVRTSQRSAYAALSSGGRLSAYLWSMACAAESWPDRGPPCSSRRLREGGVVRRLEPLVALCSTLTSTALSAVGAEDGGRRGVVVYVESALYLSRCVAIACEEEATYGLQCGRSIVSRVRRVALPLAQAGGVGLCHLPCEGVFLLKFRSYRAVYI